VNHVLNRSPTLIVKDMTPEEAWSGRKPSVEHFRVFECIAYVHIPDVKRSKLDDKNVKCVLLGFSSESKAFKMFDPVEKKVHISRDVIFEEDKKWNWEDVGYSGEESIELEWENDHEDVENAEEAKEAEEYTDNVPSPNNPPTGETIATTGRVRKPPIWYADYITGEGLSDTKEEAYMARVEIETLAFMVISDPTSFQEAVGHQKWKQAMDAEIQSIERNHTWSLTALPVGAKAIEVKWIYMTKLNELVDVDKFKAQLVVKGYAQEYGVDYTEVFAPVAQMDTVRMIIVVAAQKGWGIYQLDVKSAFLHGEPKEDVFVEQPQGYEVARKKDMVYKLHKTLYGLKQAPRAWFSRIEAYIVKEGFVSSSSEQTLFIKQKGGKILIVSIYVDDLLFTSNDDEELLNEFKRSMKDEFDMTDLGKMRYFLGIEVMQKAVGIFICQRKYVAELIKRFGMQNYNSVCNSILPGQKVGRDEASVKVDSILYKQMVGSLMYLTATRPNLMFVVSLISRFMANPTELHFATAKRIMRYLKGTLEFGIWYQCEGKSELLGYTDSDYAGNVDDSRSTSGYVFLMSGGVVAWSSRKQPIVTLSTTEAEYVATTTCACQAIWMKRILKEIGHEQDEEMILFCDNTSTTKLSKNVVMHGKSQHIRVRYHFLRELTKEGVVKLVY